MGACPTEENVVGCRLYLYTKMLFYANDLVWALASEKLALNNRGIRVNVCDMPALGD
jgi:hypothetical protein